MQRVLGDRPGRSGDRIRSRLIEARICSSAASRLDTLTMRIEIDDVSRPQVLALLEEHLRNMYEIYSAGARVCLRRRQASAARNHLLDCLGR